MRLAILISGRGSNMKTLVGAIRSGAIPDTEVSLVFSNRRDAPGLAWAEAEGLPTACLSHREFETREAFDEAVVNLLEAADTEWVALAGFMRILSPRFLRAFPDRILNIHPALLPSFPGVDTHRRALDSGVRLHGCTVHIVNEVLDGGPIVAQAAVPVLDGDTPDTLSDRVLIQEHIIYPRALALVARGAIEVRDGRVHSTAAASAEGSALVWP